MERTGIRRRAVRPWRVLVLLGLVMLPACGGDDDHRVDRMTSPTSPPPTPFVEDSLVFRAAGGSVIEMGDSAITCCGLYDPGFTNERVIRIIYYDPTLQEQSWTIEILIDATTPGSVHTLPTHPVAPHKVPYVILFAHFGEYSSSEEMASGTITLHSFECGASTMSVDFSVDATLESETMHGSTITVEGRFRAVYPKTACPY